MRLSKSFNGKSSIKVPIDAKIKAEIRDFVCNKIAPKIPKKQARLPNTVFPFVKGILLFPKTLPHKLASPSPSPSAKIPAVALGILKARIVEIIPKDRVTGPRTNLFSSRSLEAI